MNLTGGDCGVPKYIVHVVVRIQNDDNKAAKGHTCYFLDVRTVEADLAAGCGVSIPKEAGVHTYEAGGEIDYYSSLVPTQLLFALQVHPVAIRL